MKNGTANQKYPPGRSISVTLQVAVIGPVQMLPDLIGKHDIELSDRAVRCDHRPLADIVFGVAEPLVAAEFETPPELARDFRRVHCRQIQLGQPPPGAALHHDTVKTCHANPLHLPAHHCAPRTRRRKESTHPVFTAQYQGVPPRRSGAAGPGDQIWITRS